MSGFLPRCLLSTVGFVSLFSDVVWAAQAQPAARPAPRPTIVLHVLNRAFVPNKTLEGARQVVTRVFERMGVTVIWRDTSASGEDSFDEAAINVTINSQPAREDVARSKRALGLTPGLETANEGHLAYIFYDRVKSVTEARANRSTVSPTIGETLANAMLHELGHLLLPFPAHSQSGIMRESWDIGDFRKMATGELVFSTEQVERIKRALLVRFPYVPPVISRNSQSLARS